MTAIAALLPFTDRHGRLSPLRLATFVAALLPAVLLLQAALAGTLGAKAVMAAVHDSGDWAVRFLLLSLAITPLRRILAAPNVAVIRRMLGVTSLCYALLHLALYAVELNYDIPRVLREILARWYLVVGATALLGLVVLGATSFDAAMRAMGRAWGRLHRVVYLLAALAVLHFFMQRKADVFEPTLMAGLFLLLMAYRLGFALGWPVPRWWLLALFAVAGAGLTAGLEYAWYALATGVRAERVLAANLLFPDVIRPAWWVFFAGLGVAALPGLARVWARVRPKRQGRGRRAGRHPHPVPLPEGEGTVWAPPSGVPSPSGRGTG
jgi:sulfoxide reductase heme-binding subunit YedZ